MADWNTTEPTTDLGRAIKRLKANALRYRKTTEYYDGTHDLKYATDKFKNAFGNLFKEFCLNMCPAIVDAVRDKLIVTGFNVEAGGDGSISDEAWKIWQMNRMPQRAGEIHKEALKNGDAYAMVWVDVNKPGKPVTIYPESASSCTVFYDQESRGRIDWAAKYWKLADKRIRINLYYPDRTERWVTKKKAEGGILPEEKKWEPFDDGKVGGETVPNPYGVVPIFHFANNTSVGSFGVSELRDAMPVQDALNKSVLDMLIAIEFAAFRQRWATGIEVEMETNEDGVEVAKSPFVPGAERLWISESETAKFGDFEAANLEQFLKVKDGFRTDISCVTGTPLHYFMLTGAAFPQSGISIEKLESRFLSKSRDRMGSFGQTWEDLMAFALRIEGKGQDIRLFAEWENPAPLSEKETLDNLIVKQTLGIPDEQLWMEAGYGEKDIQEFQKIKEENVAKMAKSFNAGDIPPVADPNAQGN